MTNLNFENKLFLTGTCAIWHRWLWCAPTSSLSNETPLDPVRSEISELWSENHMSDCEKWQLKKWKSAKRAFLGGFLTFWVNLIRRIRILHKFWLFGHLDPSCKMTIKVKKWTKSRSLIFLCFWVILPWRTRISTRFWWFYDPLPRYGPPGHILSKTFRILKFLTDHDIYFDRLSFDSLEARHYKLRHIKNYDIRFWLFETKIKTSEISFFWNFVIIWLLF